MEMKNNEEQKALDYRVGITIFILLVVLTISEFLLGWIASAWWAPILGIALLKAFFVIRDYMHVGRLFTPDEEAHS